MKGGSWLMVVARHRGWGWIAGFERAMISNITIYQILINYDSLACGIIVRKTINMVDFSFQLDFLMSNNHLYLLIEIEVCLF